MTLNAIDRLSETEVRRILKDLLARVTTPAFGALPLREVNLVLFQALREAGVVAGDASLYTLMTQLKITRARARTLLLDIEIREGGPTGDLDARARRALAQPKGFVLDGNYLVFGIENPVVQAHIKDRVAALGHLTDASFDSTLVRIKPAAMGALVESLMDGNERAAFRQGMIAAGFDKDKSLATALTEGIRFLAEKTVGETAAAVAEDYLKDLADFLMPYARGAIAEVTAILKEVARARESQPQMRRL